MTHDRSRKEFFAKLAALAATAAWLPKWRAVSKLTTPVRRDRQPASPTRVIRADDRTVARQDIVG